MPTVIDQLYVTLELDTKKFDAGIQRALGGLKALGAAAGSNIQVKFSAASAQAKNALASTGEAGEAAGNRISGGMQRGRFAVLLLAAAVYKLNEAVGLPALRKMTQEVVDSETETFRMAQSLRLNAVELQAWQKTVQVHGGDVQSFNAGLEKMAANLGKLGTQVRGAKILQQYLGLAGINDEMVRTKDSFAVLTLFANQMQNMSVGRQFLVGKRLGLDEATIRTLQEGGPAILQQVQAMKELAAPQEELANTKEVAVEQAKANLEWGRAKQVIATAFLPQLKALTVWLTNVSRWVRANQDTVVAWAKAIGIALAAVTAGVVVLAAAWTAAAVASALATGGLSVVAGVAALAAAGLGGAAAAALLTADAFDKTADSHRNMVDEITTGDAKLDAAAARRKRALEIQAQHEQNLARIVSQASAAKKEVSKAYGGAKLAYSGDILHPVTYAADDKARIAKLEERAAGFQKIAERMTQRYGLADYTMKREIDQQFLLNPRLESALQQQTEVKINTINIYPPSGQVDFTWNGKDVIATPSGGPSVKQIATGQH